MRRPGDDPPAYAVNALRRTVLDQAGVPPEALAALSLGRWDGAPLPVAVGLAVRWFGRAE